MYYLNILNIEDNDFIEDTIIKKLDLYINLIRLEKYKKHFLYSKISRKINLHRKFYTVHMSRLESKLRNYNKYKLHN
jgi:hypothetical protein